MIQIDRNHKLLQFDYRPQSLYFSVGLYCHESKSKLWEVKLTGHSVFAIAIDDLQDGCYNAFITEGEHGVTSQKQVLVKQNKIIVKEDETLNMTI